MSNLGRLKQELAVLADIQGATGILNWDREVLMPSGAAEQRAHQASTLGGLVHKMLVTEEMGDLLETLHSDLSRGDYDSDDASIVRITWRNYQRMVRIPTEKYAGLLQAFGMAALPWREAREKSDFSIFQPHLEKLVEMQREIAVMLGSKSGNPYDALMDFFEMDLTYDYVAGVFDPLRPRLQALITQISEQTSAVSDELNRRSYPVEQQLELARFVAAQLGFDFDRGRLDLSTHPFTGGAGFSDTRMTTRASENNFAECLSSTIHETGHALHSQRIAPTLYRSGVEQPGLSICESQSRFFENQVGRSRAFWQWLFPEVQKRFPEAARGATAEDYYRAMNMVQPGFIRIEADEVTYGMHIMLRFEVENLVINGKLAVKDIPEFWNSKMQDYLGITPPNDAQGCLQDIHWSMMPMGYFSTYLLGSIFAAQLWDHLLKERPESVDEIGRGEFEAIASWQEQKVQRHGGKFTLPEMTERAVGAALSSEPYINYLTTKFSDIYGL